MSMNNGDSSLLGLDGDWDSKVGSQDGRLQDATRGLITRNDPLSTPRSIVLELTILLQTGWVAQW